MRKHNNPSKIRENKHPNIQPKILPTRHQRSIPRPKKTKPQRLRTTTIHTNNQRQTTNGKSTTMIRRQNTRKFQYNLKNPNTNINPEKIKEIPLTQDSITSGETILQFQDIYNDFYQNIQDKWNKSNRFRGFYYIYHENITEEELYQHLNHILEIIFTESIEEMILKDHKK